MARSLDVARSGNSAWSRRRGALLLPRHVLVLSYIGCSLQPCPAKPHLRLRREPGAQLRVARRALHTLFCYLPKLPLFSTYTSRQPPPAQKEGWWGMLSSHPDLCRPTRPLRDLRHWQRPFRRRRQLDDSPSSRSGASTSWHPQARSPAWLTFPCTRNGKSRPSRGLFGVRAGGLLPPCRHGLHPPFFPRY